jgi:hypothetical protein
VESPPVNATIRIVEGEPGFERVLFSDRTKAFQRAVG